MAHKSRTIYRQHSYGENPLASMSGYPRTRQAHQRAVLPYTLHEWLQTRGRGRVTVDWF